jgi:dihydroorotate dehydrogenase (fumarate)
MDLTTRYLGMTLRTPLVPSASPLSDDIGNIKKMEDFGASAVVLRSLFEEQLTHEDQTLERQMTYGNESFAEALSYLPAPREFKFAPDEYLERIHKIKAAVSIPVIASLNGATMGGWVEYAKKMQQAGADALELNIYSIPTEMDKSAAEVEQAYVDILTAIKSVVSIPVAMKLSPYFSNLANVVKRLDAAGANGLVLFNRFYQPDIHLDTLEIRPNIGLSTENDQRLPLRWIAILYDHIKADMAATSGIYTGHDSLKMLMAGASVTMLCSVLLKHGIQKIREIETAMSDWMVEHDYESVSQLQGSMSQKNCADPTAFERAVYMKALLSYQMA